MIAISLQSGSNGNCIYVEAGGARLLFDAGISGAQAELRLARRSRDIRKVDAVIISHDHSDHIRCAGVFGRRFRLPIYITGKTLDAATGRGRLGRLDDVRLFRAGETLAFGGASVETIPTPHDGVDTVAFAIGDGKRRLGILTDLGHVFDGLAEVIETLDGVFLESNYDPDMLAGGPYPAFLKQRISAGGGHLSNVEAASLLRDSAGERLKWACLAHLSEQNNNPRLAVATHRRLLAPAAVPIHVASRYDVSQVLKL